MASFSLWPGLAKEPPSLARRGRFPLKKSPPISSGLGQACSLWSCDNFQKFILCCSAILSHLIVPLEPSSTKVKWKRFWAVFNYDADQFRVY